MSKHYEFPGGVDILPGKQGESVPSGAFRLVTIGGAPYYTTDGVNFAALASAALATPSTAGLMSAAQFNAFSTSQLQTFPLLLDVTATSTGNVIVPAKPGYYFLPVVYRQLLWNKAGTLSTSPTDNVGNNVAHTNVVASGSTNFATAFAAAAQPQFNGRALAFAELVDMSTPIAVDISVAATGTGGFAMKLQYVLQGSFIPTIP